MMELRDLRITVRNNHIDEIIGLIDEQPDLLNHVFEPDNTPVNLLALAVSRNNPELVRVLLDRGAKPFAGEEFRNNLIGKLLTAGRYDDPPSADILKLLLEHGVEFPVQDQKSAWAFINFTMEKIYTFDFVDVLNAMLAQGFDPVAAENTAGISMITKSLGHHYEASSKIAAVLLACGCSVNALEKDYSTPLGKALEMHNYKFIKKLLDHGADTSKLKNIPHTLAEHIKIPTKLRDRLIKNQDLSGLDGYGLTPIHTAVQYDNSDFISYLVSEGVDINLKTKLGTPLIYAIQQNRKDMIKHLIELGADVNATNDKQETALDIAQSLAGFKRTCAMMVKAGAKTSIELSGGQDDRVALISSINKAIQPGEAWANAARESLSNADTAQVSLWNTLIRHCLDNNSSKPSKKWLQEANVLVDSIGEQLFRTNLLQWFPLVKEKRVEDIDIDDDDYYEYYGGTDHIITENNTRLLKGLIWLASRYDDNEMSRTLRDLATQMYKKVYGVGMRNAKLANAALYSLSIMPGTVGLKEIIVMRAATKYNPALVNINRVFNKLAEASGKTPDELAELSIPDYGLTDIGEFRQQLGDFEAIVNLVSVGKCELVWAGKNKTQKSVPAAIKDDYADDIKSIKALIKDVQTGCAAHSQRLEQMYLRRQSLNYETWQEQYINHKLIGFLARRLIWQITVNDSSFAVIYMDNSYVTHEGTPTEVPADASIDLWHPSMSSPQEVLAWRTFLIDQEITQPFKQAHREIYLLTDAERATRNHSLRFANHILKQSQFHALATQRGWSQQRGGSWDGGSENSAYKQLPAFNMNVSFEAQGAESYGISNTGIYECVATGELWFSTGKRVNLEKVEPLLFSEVMRDVDLFVGVTSIGNDPDWRDRENHYWSSASFGDLTETANTRKDVLSVLIPKLKIADQLRIDGRFLIVEGKLRTYKIHLGSSNILMEPNDSYLCIVEVKSKANVMLPFEGDHTLSLILSKAMMLSNDSKIKDKTILSQIKGDM